VAQSQGPAWHSQEETLHAPEILANFKRDFSEKNGGRPRTRSAGSSPKPATGNTARALNRNRIRRWHELASASLPAQDGTRPHRPVYGGRAAPDVFHLHWTIQRPEAIQKGPSGVRPRRQRECWMEDDILLFTHAWDKERLWKQGHTILSEAQYD